MSAVNVNVNVHHLTRVEGHGNIVVDVKNGELVKCEWQIVEAPRFFEAMLRGRPYYEASHITSRICGICSVGHATASLRATENALGVEISEQTELLRKLLFHGEMIDSHVLHVYMLVAPDFFGVGSVLPLAASHPEVVMRALRIKKLSGDLCAMIAGRHTHPIAMTVGGFTHLPTDQRTAGHARAPGCGPRGHGRDDGLAQDAALAPVRARDRVRLAPKGRRVRLHRRQDCHHRWLCLRACPTIAR